MIDTEVWEKPGKLDASTKCAWNHWKSPTLSYIGQLDRNTMNAMKNSAAAEALFLNAGLNDGPEQASISTLHFPACDDHRG